MRTASRYAETRCGKRQVERTPPHEVPQEYGGKDAGGRSTLESNAPKEGQKRDAAGRPMCGASLPGDPSATFSMKTVDRHKRRKKAQTRKRRRPVETDATDGNPPTTRIPTAALKQPRPLRWAFSPVHQAREGHLIRQ